MTTEAITPNQNLVEELKAIRKDLEYIKKHMFDPDTIMTLEEEKRFKISLQELKEGKTSSLFSLKKELAYD